MKNEYKSSLFIVLKNIVYGLVGSIIATLIVNIWFDLTLAIIIGSITFFSVIFFAIYSDNIRIVAEKDALLIYRFKKLLFSFNLNEVTINTKIKTMHDSDCILNIETKNETISIDCSMLGISRFYKMLEELKINKKKSKNKNSKKDIVQ